MGKDCVPKVDGYWVVKQKTLEKCGAFGPEPEPNTSRQDTCCVRKDCYLFCVEQCYRFITAFYIPKKSDDELEPLMKRPLIGVFDKVYDRVGKFKGWELYVVNSLTNATYKLYAVDSKGECVKCAKYISFQPNGNFDWFQPRFETGNTGAFKDCNKCEETQLPQAVAHGTAKRIKQRDVCKAIRDCECLDLSAFTRAIEEFAPCCY